MRAIAIALDLANGTIAASFAVSGQTVKISASASALNGEGFGQYDGVAGETDGTKHPIAVTGIRRNAAAASTYPCRQLEVTHQLPRRIHAAAGKGAVLHGVARRVRRR